MTEKKMVYIASPYAGDVEKNTAFAINACRYCIKKGHTPIAPHLLYTQMLDDNEPAQRETGLILGNQILRRCDELWVCGDRVSPGMAAEIAEAENLGITVKQVESSEIRFEGESITDIQTVVPSSNVMRLVIR